MKSEMLLTHEAQLLKNLTIRKENITVLSNNYTLKIMNYHEHVTNTNFQYLLV